jgi:recombination protein RecR
LIHQGFEDLVDLLSKLPGIGKKTALRLTFFLLENRKLTIQLSESLHRAFENIQKCSRCRNFTDESICSICSNKSRENLLCIVENPADLRSIEDTGLFRGRYFVLHGLLAPLDGVGPDKLGADLLKRRLEAENIQEVILALDSTADGDATSSYLVRMMEPFGVTVTRLARGLPVGAAVEFADGRTLAQAFEGRSRI